MNYIQKFVFDNMQGIGIGQVAMFGYNLVLCGFLAILVGAVYVRYGNTISNRHSFARNFVLIACTTMVVITFVKASLALSLGLVGALSIIRFRAAIKEPEELSYLFLSIALGLGCGAGYSTLVLVALVPILLFVIALRLRNPVIDRNLYLTIAGSGIQIAEIERIITKNCSEFKLKRYTQTNENIDASYNILYKNAAQLQSIKDDFAQISTTLSITYLDVSREF
jgi:uncharacterized membrane protein YhiD involved in acid resistance